MKKLSIVIPVYNTKISLLKKCIESILKNKYYDPNLIEIILIDDSSNNNETKKYIKSVSKKNNFKLWTNQINMGSSCCRQKGIKISNSEWISFVDSDDVIGDNYLKLILENITEDLDLLIFSKKNLYWITHSLIVNRDFVTRNNIEYNNKISNINNNYEDLHFFTKCFLSTNNVKIIKLQDYNNFYQYNIEIQENTNSVKNRNKRIYLRYIQIIDAITLVNQKNYTKKLKMIFNDQNKMLKISSLKKIFKKYDNTNKYYQKIKELDIVPITFSLLNLYIIFKKIFIYK